MIGTDWTATITFAIDLIEDTISLFTEPPASYFVGLALVSAGAGVARKFIPMKKR